MKWTILSGYSPTQQGEGEVGCLSNGSRDAWEQEPDRSGDHVC